MTAPVADPVAVPASLVEAMRAFVAAHKRAADAELAPRTSFEASRDAELARDALLAAVVAYAAAPPPAPADEYSMSIAPALDQLRADAETRNHAAPAACVCGHAKGRHTDLRFGCQVTLDDNMFCDCPGYRAKEGGGDGG